MHLCASVVANIQNPGIDLFDRAERGSGRVARGHACGIGPIGLSFRSTVDDEVSGSKKCHGGGADKATALMVDFFGHIFLSDWIQNS